MKEKMATWHWTAMLALLVFAVGGRAETVDAESIASRLSWFFSEMTITNETDILVRMMDHGVSFSAKDISGKGRGVQTIDGNGRMLLTEGDAYSFYVNWRGSDVMEVALTNAVDQSRLGNCLAKRKGMSVLVKLYAGSCQRDRGVTERNFIIDLAGERFYDVEKSYVGEFKMPFRSPWKNWDDFEENFSRRSKRDVKTECMALAARLAEGVRTCKGLEEFRNKLTNGETRVVLYQDEGHEYSITPVRLSKGLPELTKLDKRRIEQDEALELMRKDFDALCNKIYGKSETNAVDTMINLERARLNVIFYHAEKLYNFRYRRGRPQRLEDMLGAVNPGSDEPFMIDGDNYRQDLWGHPYRYYVGQGEQKSHRSNRVVIVSAGPDGVFDTADDLSSEDYFRLRKLASEKNAKK